MRRVPTEGDYLNIKRLADECYSYELREDVSRDDAITAVCKDRYYVNGSRRGQAGRSRLHRVIGSLESHVAMKLSGLL